MHARLLAMIFSCSERKLPALLGACVLLFAQSAAAMHACMLGVAEPMEVSANHADGDCAEGNKMAPGELNACMAHCQDGLISSSIDLQPGNAAAPNPASPILVDWQNHSTAPLQAQSYALLLLARVTEPPVTVRNCCLRS